MINDEEGEKMPTTVLFHGNCSDGHASAFACWQFFKDDAQYLPVFYGEPCPDIPENHTVYIVDFSYPIKTLQALLATRLNLGKSREPYVVVLDHHASAQRDLAPLASMQLRGMHIVFDMEESGASLTWKYLHTAGWNPAGDPDPRRIEHSMPLFFKYVRDRDLWQWKLPDSKAISLAYWAIEKDFPTIEQFAQNLDETEGFRRIVTEGNAMQRYADALVKEQATRAVMGDIAGYQVPIVNATTLFSEVGDYLCSQEPQPLFVAYYLDRKDSKRQWGLRGHGKVDLSAVAKLYGGGGHFNAAGFVTSQAPAALITDITELRMEGQ